MIRHYLIIAIRNLRKHKVFSLINILGLSIGLTCCLLMAIYVQHELSYDNFQQKGNRIVRLVMDYQFEGSEAQKKAVTSTKVFPAFKRNFPEVESGVRMSLRQRYITSGQNMIIEPIMYADSTLFDLFSFKLLQGSTKDALSGLNKIVLTQSAAKKYFGNTNPVGKLMQISTNKDQYLVTGVIQDCPSNSQIKYTCLASFSSLGETQEESYWGANYITYLLLNKESDIPKLQAKIPVFMKKEMQLTGKDYFTFDLEPFTKIHLYSHAGFEPNNSITYIYIIAAVVLLILTIACFTYINLSTARSMERAKEVGIRKVAGALKAQVLGQFIGESVILSVIALLLSFGLTYLLLPVFSKLAEGTFYITSLFSPFILWFSLSTIVCISLLAGSYPALILSRYQPVKVLKGAFKNTSSGLWLRKSLIIFQFVISAFLIVSVSIITKQLQFIQNTKLGFDNDYVLVLPNDEKIYARLNTIKTEFKTNPDVLSIASTVNDPANIFGGYFIHNEAMGAGKGIHINATPVDEDFIKTTGLTIIAGNDFTIQDLKDAANGEGGSNTYHFILNETAVKQLGWTPQQAVGQKVYLGEDRPGLVKAVVKDFHSTSMHELINPVVLFNEPWGTKLLVKVSGKNMPQAIVFLQQKWKVLVPHRPFDYHFLDEDYDALYKADMQLGKVLSIFTAIAVILACLGLFGLSAYSIQQRTREIGIRKVLGASVSGIVMLLSKEFIYLVIVSLLVAFPLAWWAMNKWLQDFAYRTDVNWWIFAIAGLISIVIAFLTVSILSIATALSNPVHSLKSE
jgi:putative ABC transport system permease protein